MKAAMQMTLARRPGIDHRQCLSMLGRCGRQGGIGHNRFVVMWDLIHT